MEIAEITLNGKLYKLVPKGKLYKLVPIEADERIYKYRILNNQVMKDNLKEYIDELKTSNLLRHKFAVFQKAFNEKYNINIASNDLSLLLDELKIKKIRPKNIRTLLL
jgi:hypothetical protein